MRHFLQVTQGKIIKANILMQRIAHIDEIRGTAILLASQALSFMTGPALVIGGGHTVH